MEAGSREERVELVRVAWEAYAGGDIEAVLEFFDPEIEVYTAPELVNAGTYRGREEFLRWIAAWNEAWGELDNEVAEIEPVGERHVADRVRQRGRGRGSGAEVTMDVGWVYEVRGRSCVHMGLHPSFDAAMAVAREREGIEPEGG